MKLSRRYQSVAIILVFGIGLAAIQTGCGKPLPESSPKLYTAAGSSEAILTFDYKIEFTSATLPRIPRVRELIESQLTYLFGPFSANRYPAVPKGNHEITNIRIGLKPGLKRTYVATYSYRGTIVVRDGAPETKYPVTLPANPAKIYKAGIVISGTKETYPCTDPHYTTNGDFWYFWNPKQAGCPLEIGKDYDVIPGRLQRIANTTLSYPEYSRLADENGTIAISMLMGMDDPTNGRNPLTSSDVNAGNYRNVKFALTSRGYESRKWSAEEILAVAPGLARKDMPYVEEFVKNTFKARIVVRLFFGPSGITQNSTAFHYFFKDAMENAAVMIYDGHSGLGGHLDLPTIESVEEFTFQPNPNRYQIYFFNSCSSYTYYNSMYFGRKQTMQDPKGTKNLDILTNGLETYFYVMHETNLALVGAIEKWGDGNGMAAPSFQDLARTIDSDNLFGINGDEDNPPLQ